jgi:hypothetical protein
VIFDKSELVTAGRGLSSSGKPSGLGSKDGVVQPVTVV